jgi:zinc transporter ZupT
VASSSSGSSAIASSTTTTRQEENVSSLCERVKPASSAISVPVTKLLSQFLLSSINVVCWWIPLHSPNFAQNDLVLSMASCFSGGVFLALALTHLLPHAVEEMDEAKGNKFHAYLACLFGYMLVLFIDKVAFSDKHELMQGQGGGGTNSALVLLVAMGVHSLLETIALGMAKDKASAVMMAASVGLHQPAETLALLVAFLKTGMAQEEVVYFLVVFSVIGPVGVCLGLYFKQIASAKTDALIMAVTAGTFLFMGATEMVSEEFNEGSRNEKIQKYMAICAGAVTIIVLTNQSDKWESMANA